MRVRMKANHTPIILGVTPVPAHPEYFEPPACYEAAVENLCAPGGPLERAPFAERGPNGTFVPADPAARPAPPPPVASTERGNKGRFQRKAGV